MFKKLLFVAAIGISGMVFSQNAVKEKMSDYLDSLFIHHKVMGSFALVENDHPTFIKAVGFADAEKNNMANVNTQYRIGSISKTFTAVLIMKAVEEKKISLDKKLSDFYPDIPNADKITTENLLQHRTGIHNLTDEAEYGQYYTKPQTETSLINIIKKYKSDFEPGSRHEYSNSNYILLGFILEKIYKKSYSELVKEKITKPLKLTFTEVGGKIDTSKNQAKSYQFINGKYEASSETDMSIPIGAGNIISTPSDLLTFILGLEQGKLIKKQNVEKMKNFVDGYGYGILKVPFEKDYFTLMDFSAKWDPIPSMLCQNHTQLVKGFMGQTTSYDIELVKSNVLVMGTCELNGEARYIHGQKGKGMFSFYSGHDPEDFQHQVGDPPTVLDLHPNSPGYRLILNNVLFPAAKKKKLKT